MQSRTNTYTRAVSDTDTAAAAAADAVRRRRRAAPVTRAVGARSYLPNESGTAREIRRRRPVPVGRRFAGDEPGARLRQWPISHETSARNAEHRVIRRCQLPWRRTAARGASRARARQVGPPAKHGLTAAERMRRGR